MHLQSLQRIYNRWFIHVMRAGELRNYLSSYVLLLLLLSIFVRNMGCTKGWACKRAPQGTKTHTHTSSYYNVHTYIMT